MRSIRIVFLAAFTCLLISACTVAKGNAPRSIKGMTIAYYTLYSNEPCDRNTIGKNLLYKFDTNGSYTSTLDGQKYSYGNYSYGKKKPNIASITMSYSTTANNPRAISSPKSTQSQQLSYMLEMTFKTPHSGTWRTIFYVDDPNATNEYGTFEIIKFPNTH